MAVKSAAAAAAKYSAGVAGGQQAYVDGVQAVTEDPLEKAANAGQQAVQGYTAAWSSGRVQARLRAVGIQGWKSAVAAKAANWGVGVTGPGKDKYQAAYQKWLPTLEATQATVRAMPGVTIDQRIARSAAWARALHDAKQTMS